MRARWLPAMMLAALVLTPCHAWAAVLAGDKVSAVSAGHPLPLDPSLSDPEWKRGMIPESPFLNLTTRQPAKMATLTYVLYDTASLYVGFQCKQPGVPITATQLGNDVGFGIDDFFGIGIDTSGNGSQVYFFETTPKGVRYQQASDNARYRPSWQVVAQSSGDSWSGVMIIPLKILHVGSGSVQSWRLNFVREVAALGEHYSWGTDTLMQDGPSGQWPLAADARFWPTIDGIKVAGGAASVRSRPRADIYGLESVGRDRKLFAQSSGAFLPEDIRNAGVDFTYPLTPTINFVGAANPDFSNVEIDQQTISPQEFRRALQEYRPFFAQGAEYVNSNPYGAGGLVGTPNSIFYSPGVGPFDRGEKMEGTFGYQSFGILNFRGFDQITGNTFDDTAYGYRHILPDHSFLYYADGVEAHHSIGGNDSTNEFGVAARNVKSGLLGMVSDSFEAGSAVGAPGRAHSLQSFALVHKPFYTSGVQFLDISPNYSPLDGFTSNSDIRGVMAFTSATGNPPGLKNDGLFVYGDRYLDRSGAVHQADSALSLSATFKNGFSINGIGPSVGLLRRYAAVNPAVFPLGCNDPGLPYSYYTGFPNYACGVTDRYNLMGAAFGLHDGTPAPIDWSASEGPFGPFLLHSYTLSTSRPLGKRYSISMEYDGTYERSRASGLLDSQWLRRLTFGETLGADSNLSVSLRSINGTGGFAAPGLNVAASFHRKFSNGNDLYINFGTPAASQTLDRLVVKYVFHQGGGSGT